MKQIQPAYSTGDLAAKLAIYVCLCICIAVGFQHLSNRATKLCLPRIGKNPKGIFGLAAARADFLNNGRLLVEEGYSKYKDSMYVVQTADMERIVMSSKYVEELRNLPDSQLSSIEALCDRHLAWWNTLDVVKHSRLHADVSRVQLNQNLGRLLGGLVEEVEHAFSNELLKCTPGREDYEYLPANNMILRITSAVVNRALVGLPICRNKEWFQATMGYAADAFTISGSLRPRSRLIRPLVYFFLHARRSLNRHMATARRLLVPVIQHRESGDKSHADVLQWMVDNAQGSDKDPKELTHKILFSCLASVTSSNMGIVHLLYDLCAMPELFDPLRQEIQDVLEEEGGWTVSAIHRMKRLDSFLKESQRMNHPGLFSFNRKVMQRIQLTDGNFLPAGSFISMPTYCIARDANFYESSLTFKPFRFYAMRQENSEESNHHQFTSTSTINLAFGHGKWSCPGRFFAACEMKLILAYLLHHYDFRYPENQIQRPENTYVDERIWPSKTQLIGFRRRLPAKVDSVD